MTRDRRGGPRPLACLDTYVPTPESPKVLVGLRYAVTQRGCRWVVAVFRKDSLYSSSLVPQPAAGGASCSCSVWDFIIF
jgi:hypothetical protein